VHWSAVWVGALSALAAALVLGLAGSALGLHLAGPAQQITSFQTLSTATIAFAVVSAMLAFFLGGWVAVRVAGFHFAEPAMAHGAIAWLAAVPIFLVATAFGGGSYLGSWYGGLSDSPAWTTPTQAAVTASRTDTVPQDADTQEAARIARNSALAAVTMLLVGLICSVIGGWVACGDSAEVNWWPRRWSSNGQRTNARVTQSVS
jgi:hypothetical protein